MTDRQYISCGFRPDATKGYTYHNDGPPVAPGDRVVVESRNGGESKVTVLAVVDQPDIETNGILRLAEEPAPDAEVPA